MPHMKGDHMTFLKLFRLPWPATEYNNV